MNDNDFALSKSLKEEEKDLPGKGNVSERDIDEPVANCAEVMKLENNQMSQYTTLTNGDAKNELNGMLSIKDGCRTFYKRIPKSKSGPSASSLGSYVMSSDSLIRENEIELRQLTNFSPLPKQSIYKLAFDESITDQSDSEELDASELPSSTMPGFDFHPNSAFRSEILVHEADSASDAGSEDVELLPHRYESESAQKTNKHIYVNNLSLAVEMLRAREDLPCENEFKRIANDNFPKSLPIQNKAFVEIMKPLTNTGSINPAFDKNACHIHPPSYSEPNANSSVQITDMLTMTLKTSNIAKINKNNWRKSAADSGVLSEDSSDETCQTKETDVKQVNGDSNVQCDSRSAEIKTNFRRQATQAQYRFNIYTPRNSVNPCLCCCVM